VCVAWNVCTLREYSQGMLLKPLPTSSAFDHPNLVILSGRRGLLGLHLCQLLYNSATRMPADPPSCHCNPSPHDSSIASPTFVRPLPQSSMTARLPAGQCDLILTQMFVVPPCSFLSSSLISSCQSEGRLRERFDMSWLFRLS
jgi:hypothetical protein